MNSMRNYLKNLEIVGAVLIYREGEIVRWSLDWLYANCDRVCVMLDNPDDKTRNIVIEYRDKYPDITSIEYVREDIDRSSFSRPGKEKQRFKRKQDVLREQMMHKLKVMHAEKKIDLLIWPDSDETFVDSFPSSLEQFYESDATQLVLGFVEVYDSFRIILNQRMIPHGRAWKYNPDMTAIPYQGRTRYRVYKKDFKVRHTVIHMCHFTEEQRAFRKSVTNIDVNNPDERRVIWFLPEDIRTIDPKVLKNYRVGRHRPAKIEPTILIEYINNKNKYKEYV